MVCGGGSFVQETLRYRVPFLYPLHVSKLHPTTNTTMEKEPDKVEALPATDPYLGVPEDLEHTGKNRWARLWPVIVSSILAVLGAY